MNNRKLLAPLLAFVLLVTLAGVARLLWIGTQLQGESLLALAAVPGGGFVLSTDRRLLEFDAGGTLRREHPAAALGLQEPGAMHFTPDGTLWLFDRRQRRLHECNAAFACTPRSDATLGLDRNALFAVSPAHGLIAISDNDRHRLLLLDKQGRLLLDSANHPPLHYPNQLVFDGDSLLLADSDRYVIQRLPFVMTPRIALQAPQHLHGTQRRPYRFAQDAGGWWVLEAGTTLTHGELVFYPAGGNRTVLDTTVQDPVDFLLQDGHLIVASREDRQLLRIDIKSGRASALGSARLKAEWLALAQRERALLRERGWIPPGMLVLLLPALLFALLLQQQKQREAVVRGEACIDPGQVAALRAGNPVRLLPGAEGLQTLRRERNTVLAFSLGGLLLVPGLCWVIAGAPTLIAFRSSELRPLLLIVVAVAPLLLAGLVLGVVQYRRRLTRVLQFTAGGVELHEAGKPKAAAPYAKVRLEQTHLMLDRFSLPLYLDALRRTAPYWPRARIRALLDLQQPAPETARRIGDTLQLEIDAADADRLRRQRRILRLLTGGGLLVSTAAGACLLLLLPAPAVPQMLPPMGGIFCLFLLGLLFLERLYGRLLDTRLLLGQETLTVQGGAGADVTVPYAQVWLGDHLLVAGRRAVRLALRSNNYSQRVIELFPLDALRAELRARLPADHLFATDVALHLALLRQGQGYGVQAALRTAALLLLGLGILVIDFYLKA